MDTKSPYVHFVFPTSSPGGARHLANFCSLLGVKTRGGQIIDISYWINSSKNFHD